MGSLSRGVLARLVSDGVGLLAGLVAGMITARWLGPSGKGIYSSVTYALGLLGMFCAASQGEAAVVEVGQGRATIQRALSATLGLTLATSAAGVAVLVGLCRLGFRADAGVVVVSCLYLPLIVWQAILPYFLNVQDKFVSSSAALLVTSCTTTLGLWLFVAVGGLSVPEALLASVCGLATGLAITAALLGRSGLSLRPRWDPKFFAASLPYGLKVQASSLLTALTGRLDLVIVLALAGRAAAGHYSIALTISALVGLAPLSLTVVTFARLSRLDEADALRLTARSCRYALAAALGTGAALAVVVPSAVPLVFGAAYRPAVVPTLLLIPSVVLASGQWVLSRSYAARGRPGLLLLSYGVNTIVMALGDLALIPFFGNEGAAAAAFVGSSAGLLVCLAAYRRETRTWAALAAFSPCRGDLLHGVGWLRSALSWPERGGP